MSKDVIAALSLYHKNVAVKVKMNVEDNLDSDNFYDFWQLSGCAVVLCHNVRHISKITTEKNHSTRCECCDFELLDKLEFILANHLPL